MAAISGGSGQLGSIGATALALSTGTLTTTATTFRTKCVIKSVAANSTNFIYVGNVSSLATSSGFQLASGVEETFDVGFFGGDLANAYVIGSTTGLAVSFWYV